MRACGGGGGGSMATETGLKYVAKYVMIAV